MPTYVVYCPSCGAAIGETDGSVLIVYGDGQTRNKTTTIECECGCRHVWHSKRGGNYGEIIKAVPR